MNGRPTRPGQACTAARPNPHPLRCNTFRPAITFDPRVRSSPPRHTARREVVQWTSRPSQRSSRSSVFSTCSTCSAAGGPGDGTRGPSDGRPGWPDPAHLSGPPSDGGTRPQTRYAGHAALCHPAGCGRHPALKCLDRCRQRSGPRPGTPPTLQDAAPPTRSAPRPRLGPAALETGRMGLLCLRSGWWSHTGAPSPGSMRRDSIAAGPSTAVAGAPSSTETPPIPRRTNGVLLRQDRAKLVYCLLTDAQPGTRSSVDRASDF